jgi:hypothetical protein
MCSWRALRRFRRSSVGLDSLLIHPTFPSNSAVFQGLVLQEEWAGGVQIEPQDC